jgi:Ca-activated chloride channel family protein
MEFNVVANLFLLIVLVSPATPQEARPYQISVNVDLVVLPVTVRDRSGHFVSDLGDQDFAVFEDGARQSIRLFRHVDTPVTVGLVVDHSGSMRRKLADVIAAARTFARSSNSEDQMFVVNFNEKVTLGLPASVPFTNKPDELESAILNAPAMGQTALYDAVVRSIGQLQIGSREKKALIVISDGGDNKSAHTLAEALKMAEQSSAVIYAIGIFDPDESDAKPDVLRRLARESGGEAFFPRHQDEVVPICETIAHAIRNQYTLGYVSSNLGRPGTWRSIRVAAHAAGKSKLLVRTRSGYIASGSPK